jgi:hypothetical protein
MLVSTSRTLARISSAVAVQTNGLALVFQCVMYAYLLDQDFDAAKGSPTDGLAGDEAKPRCRSGTTPAVRSPRAP